MSTTHTGARYVDDPAFLADNCLPSEISKPHAVIVPWPGQGHINPLLHLSHKLIDQGFSVTFVNIEYTHMRVISSIRRQEEQEELAGPNEQAKATQQPSSQENSACTSRKLCVNFVSVPDGIRREDTRSGNVPELFKGLLRSSPAFERLLRSLEPAPTCIISDTFALHTQDAANKLGIPRVAFWTQSAASYAIQLAAARGLIKLPLDLEENCVTTIPGAPRLRIKDLPTYVQRCDWSDLMFDCAVRPFLRMHEAACVLMNTFDALEGAAMAALQQQQPDCTFYAIGPTLPLEYVSPNPKKEVSQSLKNKTVGLWAEDYRCLQWLDKREEGSVLYVSFGSITELSRQEMEEFALGLEATGFPVLWVLRPESLEGGGELGLPTGFARRTEGHVLIIEWAPQLHVLAHVAIGGFLTHGGWNSTLEGIAQGKPMLGFPYFADQMMNCRCIEEEWGNGLALERHGEGALTRSLVESKVRAIMQAEGKLRDSALKLRDEARRAILSTDPGSSTANLNTFLQSLVTLQKPTTKR